MALLLLVAGAASLVAAVRMMAHRRPGRPLGLLIAGMGLTLGAWSAVGGRKPSEPLVFMALNSVVLLLLGINRRAFRP